MAFFSKLFNKTSLPQNALFAPCQGRVVPLSQVPDPTFAEGMLGDGVAIIPSCGKVYAPCDGKVDTMFETGHAVSLVSDSGAEVLIHVGLETVSLNGGPFKVHCSSGDKVKKGQLLMEADLDAIRAAGLEIITPVVVCNADAYSSIHKTTDADVTNEDVVITLDK